MRKRPFSSCLSSRGVRRPEIDWAAIAAINLPELGSAVLPHSVQRDVARRCACECPLRIPPKMSPSETTVTSDHEPVVAWSNGLGLRCPCTGRSNSGNPGSSPGTEKQPSSRNPRVPHTKHPFLRWLSDVAVQNSIFQDQVALDQRQPPLGATAVPAGHTGRAVSAGGALTPAIGSLPAVVGPELTAVLPGPVGVATVPVPTLPTDVGGDAVSRSGPGSVWARAAEPQPRMSSAIKPRRRTLTGPRHCTSMV